MTPAMATPFLFLLVLVLLSLCQSHGYRYKDPVNMLKRSMHQNVSVVPESPPQPTAISSPSSPSPQLTASATPL